MTDLNDSLDDLLAGPMGEVRIAPLPARAPVDYAPASFNEPCRKCNGSGLYRAPSTRGSHCFACNGKGKLTFKTSPETRAKSRASVANRKARKAQEIADAIGVQIEAFKVANPAVYNWLTAKGAAGSNFANSVMGGLLRFGSLTSGQIEAVERMIAQDVDRAKVAAERVANAPQADTAGIDRLKTAFDHAKARAAEKGRGIRNLRLTIGGVTISPAGDNSRNPGALYVKSGADYLGKISGGRFFAVRDCTDDQQKRILAFVADPKAAAEAYGQETGVCCVCNAPLTNKVSIERGIGPICAEKFGW